MTRFAADEALFSNSEIWHYLCETNNSRLLGFKTGLEKAVSQFNRAIQRLNAESHREDTSKIPTYKIGRRTYEFYRIGKEIFAIPAGMSGKVEPVSMGSTQQEFLASLEILRTARLTPLSVEY